MQIGDGIHGVLSGSIADATALAAGIVIVPGSPGGRAVAPTDVGKVFQRLDTGVWYGLFSVAPLNFWVVGDGSTSVYSHGDLPGGTLHALATTTQHGFYSSTDKVDNDAHRASTANPHSTTAAQVGAIATAGAMAVSGTPTTGQVLTALTGTTAEWQTPASGGVSSARIIASGAGLTGGGDLTADRTLAVGANADGSIVVNADDIQVGVLATDAQHGVRGGGTQHALATGSVAGFMSAADKVKLDGLGSGLALSSTVPSPLGTAAIGDGTTAARSNHVHAHGDQAGGSLHALVVAGGAAGFISGADKTKLDGIASGATATPLSSSTPTTASAAAGAAGAASTAARGDHAHQVSVGSPVAVGTANADGSSNSLARADHVHALALVTTGTQGAMSAADKVKLDGIASGATNTPLSSTLPSPVGTAAIGVGSTAARHDHVHAHGDQAGGSLHALVVAGGAAGFISGADKTKLDGIASGATATPLATTTPNPVLTGTAGYIGLGIAAARSDHAHAHGSLPGGSNHSLVTSLSAGFMAPADKDKLDGIAAGATVGALPISETVQHLYLASTGSDANSGANSGVPVLTLAGAYARVGTARHAVIHVASGTYAYAIKPARLAAQQITLWVDGAGQSGDDGRVVVATGTTLAGTDQLGVTASGLTVNAYRGCTIEFLTGPAAGWHATVRDNTATRITPCWPYVPDFYTPTSPGVGSNYRITRPGATFTFAALEAIGANILAEGSGDRSRRGLTIINAKLYSTYPPYITRTGVRLFGCEANSGLFLVDSSVDAGYCVDDVYDSWATDVGASTGLEWFGWGFSDPEGTVSSIGPVLMNNGLWRGPLVGGNFTPGAYNYYGEPTGIASLMGGSFLGTIYFNRGEVFQIVPIWSATVPAIKTSEVRLTSGAYGSFNAIEVSKPSTGVNPLVAAVAVFGDSKLIIAGSGSSIQSASGSDALQVSRGARCELFGTGAATLSATGGGSAISVRDGGHLFASGLTVTCSSADDAVKIASDASLVVASDAHISATSSTGVGCRVQNGSRLSVRGSLTASGTDGLSVESASVADMTVASSISLTGTSAVGLRVNGRSVATLAGGGSSTIAGATYGIDATDDGHVRAFGALSAVTGGTAQTRAEFGVGVVVDNVNVRLDALEQRTHLAGAGLSGGGNHLFDWTMNIGQNADNSIIVNANDIQIGTLATDGQHGVRGGGTQHAAVTTSTNGFMSSADKIKLDGIATGATNLALSSATPAPVGAAAAGSGTTAARADHVHAHGDQAGGTLHALVTTSVHGFMSATDKVKLDAIGALSSATPALVSAAAGVPGSSSNLARADHSHQVSVASPVTVGTTNLDGSSNSLARADHVHAHGNQAGGSLHALATLTSGGLPGFMSALSLKQVQGLAGDGGITRRKLSLAAGHETNTAGGGETPHTPSNWSCQGHYWITGPSTSLAGWVIFPLNELLVHGSEFNELRVSVAAAGGAANRIAVAVYRCSGNGTSTQLGSTQNNAGVGGLQHLTVSDFSTTADLWEYTYFVTVQQLIAGAGDLILDVRAGFSFP
jgi:hypothetical protein